MRNMLVLRWVALVVLGMADLFLPFPVHSAAPAEQTIRIQASSYEYSPAVVRVNPQDRVTIELVSTDVVHGIYIDDYNLEITADPGQTASLSFIADRPGSFRFRCSVTCGALHPFMIGKFQVGPNMLLWRGAGLALLAVLASLFGFRR